jgi:hypothetical protein
VPYLRKDTCLPQNTTIILRLLKMPMNKPTKTLPKHPISPSQPLHNDLARQINNPNPKSQFNLTFHILDHTIALLALVGSAVRPTPDVLARFADACGGFIVPGKLEVERRELCGNGVLGSFWVDR